MPDTRRINGPEVSHDYRLFASKTEKTSHRGAKKKKRSDGRQAEEHRPVYLKAGLVTKARGSAYMECGQTKIIAAVYGPREIPRRSDFSMKGLLSCTFERTAFAKRTRKGYGPSNQEEQELSAMIGQALEATVCMHMYPKSQLDVFITVLEDDGSALSAALTCASLALADGGVHMFDILLGTSVKISGSKKFLDPTTSEEEFEDDKQFDLGQDRVVGQLTIGYQPTLEQMPLVSQEGHLTADRLVEEVQDLTKAASRLSANVKSCLEESLKSKSADKQQIK